MQSLPWCRMRANAPVSEEKLNVQHKIMFSPSFSFILSFPIVSFICFCCLDFYRILYYLRRVYILSLSPEWKASGSLYGAEDRVVGRERYNKKGTIWTRIIEGRLPDQWVSVLHCWEALTASVKRVLLRFKKKNNLEHREAILWNIQINLPSLERQKNICIL